MALSGRRTLRIRRIFTTEIAEDLQETHWWTQQRVSKERQLIHKAEWYVLNAEGDQRHTNHQQVQKVEVVSTEGSFMKKRSKRCHLYEAQAQVRAGQVSSDTHTHTHMQE